MELKDNFFIGTYTNQVKDYCDKEFFSNLSKISKGVVTYVIDNTPGWDYFNKISKLIPTSAGAIKINVPLEPKNALFQRNVRNSANTLRDLFLATNKKYLLFIESDVIPPTDLIEKFGDSIWKLDNELTYGGVTWETGGVIKPWGILGGIYYKGFHKDLKGLQPTHHVLSGCTIYKREVIEKFPFRYDPQNLGPFPDALMSFDAGKDYTLWDDHNIQCDHLHTKHGSRMSRSL